MLSVGEVSGDLHASFLVKELKRLSPEISFFGMGGEKMAAAGVDIKLDISKRNTIGLIEALPQLFSIFTALSKMKKLLKKQKPDLLILVDSQGFNLPLAKYARKLGIKTCYYIPPQEWLWGSEKNLIKAAKAVDSIVAIFKKEFEAYKKHNQNTSYFGHPLLDIVKPTLSKTEARERFFGHQPKKVVAICPGSRNQEIKNIFPILLNAAKLLKEKHQEIEYIIPIAAEWIRPLITNKLKEFGINAVMVQGLTYDVLNSADLIIATSGTINLEATILKVPNLMVYRVSPLTYWIGMHILKIGEKMKYLSMPNLLANNKIIPEVTQNNVTPENIFNAAEKLISEPSSFSPQLAISQLGTSPVIAKIAKNILKDN